MSTSLSLNMALSTLTTATFSEICGAQGHFFKTTLPAPACTQGHNWRNKPKYWVLVASQHGLPADVGFDWCQSQKNVSRMAEGKEDVYAPIAVNCLMRYILHTFIEMDQPLSSLKVIKGSLVSLYFGDRGVSHNWSLFRDWQLHVCIRHVRNRMHDNQGPMSPAIFSS